MQVRLTPPMIEALKSTPEIPDNLVRCVTGAKNEGDRLSFGGQREQTRGVGGKIPARDSLDGRREPPVGIACRHANRLAAEIKPDQGAASRQMRGRLGQGKDQCGHERGVARPRPADHLQAAA